MTARPTAMSGHLVRGLICVAVLMSSGLLPVMIQLFGWATMLPQTLSEGDGLMDAVEQTIGGESPCGLCTLAAELSGSNDASAEGLPAPTAEKESPKLQSVPTGEKRIRVFGPGKTFVGRIAVNRLKFVSRSKRPQLPPPRLG